jgi:hypothetical protein
MVFNASIQIERRLDRRHRLRIQTFHRRVLNLRVMAFFLVGDGDSSDVKL